MAGNKKISQLVDGGAGQAGDNFVIERGGVNFKVDNSSISGNPGGLLLDGIVNDMIVKDEKSEVALEQRIALLSVLSFVDNTAAPPTEVNGDIYLLDDTGASNAAWDGNPVNTWVKFDGTAGLWKGIAPVDGMIVTEGDTGDTRYFKPTTSTWELLGGGIPAGADTEIQFNNAGVFGASSLFTFNTAFTEFKVDANVVINESGNARDFRIESLAEANMFFVDGSSDAIGIGTNGPRETLDVMGVTILEEPSGFEPLTLFRDSNTATFGVRMKFDLDNSVGTQTTYAAITGSILDNTSTSEDGNLIFNIADSGSLLEVARFISTSTGKKMAIGMTGPVSTLDVEGFDSTSSNFAFRAGGDGNNNTLVVRNDRRVIIGGSSPSDLFQVNATGNASAFVVRDSDGYCLFGDVAVLASFTVAGAPADDAGGMIFVTDEVGGSVPAFNDGSDWRRVTDRAIIST